MTEELIKLIEALHQWPPESVWVMTAVIAYGAVVTIHRIFGLAGLFAYVPLALMVANIQVLKQTKFAVYPDPVAMGTIVFCTLYFATDLISERYGHRHAIRAVWIGFFTQVTFVLLMILTLAFRPVTEADFPEGKGEWAISVHDHMMAIFLPAPAFLLAGMTAYLTSQLLDVWLFKRIREATSGKKLWLRNNISTLTSTLVDNTVFSLVIWLLVLRGEGVRGSELIFTYILGVYGLRIVLALFDTPFLYLACRWKPRDEDLPASN